MSRLVVRSCTVHLGVYSLCTNISKDTAMASSLLFCCLYYFLAVASTVPDISIDLQVLPWEITIGRTQSLEVLCQTRLISSSLFSVSLLHSLGTDAANYTYIATVANVDGSLKTISDNSVNVTGAINNAGKSYVRLTVARPTFKRTGFYQCEISGIDASGKPVVTSNYAQVRSSNTDMDAVFEKIENFTHLYYETIQSLESKIGVRANISAANSDILRLQTSFTQLNRSVVAFQDTSAQEAKNFTNLFYLLQNEVKFATSKCETKLKEMSSVQTNFQSTLQTLTDKLEAFEKQQAMANLDLKLHANTLASQQLTMASLKIQSGNFMCGQYVRNFPITLTRNERAEDFQITFPTPFANQPIILLHVTRYDVFSGENFRFDLDKYNVTNSGFVGRCLTWGTTVIYRIRVEWTALDIPTNEIQNKTQQN
ncbi:H-type lectin domain-containing protein [Biomphalaria glabrata]|nr:H-type lectin domain-containing protein [Biomphalaria glabrata]